MSYFVIMFFVVIIKVIIVCYNSDSVMTLSLNIIVYWHNIHCIFVVGKKNSGKILYRCFIKTAVAGNFTDRGFSVHGIAFATSDS